MAVNCCEALDPSDALVGLTATVVATRLTVTLTALVVVCPPWSAIVTNKLYVPNLVNVAVVFLAALVPLAEKFTAAGGVPVVDQVYVRFASPPPSLSAPRTERFAVVPVTGLGDAAAAVATVGAKFEMLTRAVALSEDLYIRTSSSVPAKKRPPRESWPRYEVPSKALAELATAFVADCIAPPSGFIYIVALLEVMTSATNVHWEVGTVKPEFQL